MRLQCALDGTLSEALEVLALAHPYIDIAEIGTPLIYREGMHAAHRLREAFPALPLLADLKIMDAGEYEAQIAFEAGCRIVTVLALANEKTIQGAVRAARAAGGAVFADLVEVSDPLALAPALLDYGVDVLCVHTGTDRQSAVATGDALASLRLLRESLPQARLALAGGITLEMIDRVAALDPAVVVVGGGITRSPDPAAAARAFKERMAA